ncbi:MAG: outer membrane protein assembly factor BamD [Verrucomicrobiota bacterium]|nr:outer membrane protein assembly factor BamD [Verrucomicrobiota bacterium]
MRRHFFILFLLIAALTASVETGSGAIVFKPGEKAEYLAPGEERMSGTAQQLFDIAEKAENSRNYSRAIKAYRAIVRKYPRDALASGAAFRYAQLQEKIGDDIKAAAAYRVLVEQYPKNPHFDEAIEAQFRIGELYMNGKKIKLFGLPIKVSLDKAIEIFAGIVRSAPYGRYTARAQFNIGRATEKMGNAEGAVAAYQAVVEKFPDDPLAADAQYQIGYLWQKSAASGVKDAKATKNAQLGYQDFLYRYPKSEKAAQARENLQRLEQRQTTNSLKVAKFYDKQKSYRAAVIYYNDVLKQMPGSAAAEQAKKRIAQLRAKFGDKAIQSVEAASNPKKQGKQTASNMPGHGSPIMHTSPGDVAPLPPPEADESLPPPTSLNPDPTGAPDLPPVPTPAPTPEPSASPE